MITSICSPLVFAITVTLEGVSCVPRGDRDRRNCHQTSLLLLISFSPVLIPSLKDIPWSILSNV